MQDEDFLRSYVGKHLLIGMTREDREGNVTDQKQLHGPILRMGRREGIVIRRADTGEEYALPPDVRALFAARRGEYRLRSTGEVVVDPDFVTTWTINPHKDEAS